MFFSYGKLNFVPSGFTFSCIWNEEEGCYEFYPVCKQYGVETHSTGLCSWDDMSDYTSTREGITPQLITLALEYLKEKAPDIYAEVERGKVTGIQ
ncbi:MAG: hypothetical protein Q4B58_06950 [Bacteroidales bacterium]|nr:hypothetical protein [Bacteroidales bacterium]